MGKENSICQKHTLISHKSLNTLFVDREGIVNLRPLMVETISDVSSQVVESCDALACLREEIDN